MHQNTNIKHNNAVWPTEIPKIKGEVVELALLHFQMRNILSPGLDEFLLREYNIDVSAVVVQNRSGPVNLSEQPFLDIIFFVIFKSIQNKATANCIASIFNTDLHDTSSDPVDNERLNRYEKSRENHKSENATLDSISCQLENNKAANRIRWRVKFLVDCQILVEYEIGKEKHYYPSKPLLKYLDGKTDFLNPEN